MGSVLRVWRVSGSYFQSGLSCQAPLALDRLNSRRPAWPMFVVSLKSMPTTIRVVPSANETKAGEDSISVVFDVGPHGLLESGFRARSGSTHWLASRAPDPAS